MKRRAITALLVVALLLAAFLVARDWQRSPQSAPAELYNRTVYPLEHDATICAAARRQRLDPALVAAMIYVESGFDERARSKQGAIGLMQLLPETATHIARETGGSKFTVGDLEDPEVNIRYGTYHLRTELNRFGGSTLAAVASYNAGAGAVEKWVAEAAARDRRLKASDIPYPETRAYVDEVFRLREIYRTTYSERLQGSPKPQVTSN